MALDFVRSGHSLYVTLSISAFMFMIGRCDLNACDDLFRRAFLSWEIYLICLSVGQSFCLVAQRMTAFRFVMETGQTMLHLNHGSGQPLFLSSLTYGP